MMPASTAVLDLITIFDRLVASHHFSRNELVLLIYIHQHRSISNIRDNPKAVVSAIEEFASHSPKGLITIGSQKRDHIINLFATAAGCTPDGPIIFLDFGAYVGYSTIALGAALRDLNSEQKVNYFSFERNPWMASVTSSLVELAGLKDVVSVQVGPASESVKRLVAEGKLKKGSIDFMLLDHSMDFYISDLQLCEELGLLQKGTVVLANRLLNPETFALEHLSAGALEHLSASALEHLTAGALKHLTAGALEYLTAGFLEYLAYVKKGTAKKSAEGLRYETKIADIFMSESELAITTVI